MPHFHVLFRQGPARHRRLGTSKSISATTSVAEALVFFQPRALWFQFRPTLGRHFFGLPISPGGSHRIFVWMASRLAKLRGAFQFAHTLGGFDGVSPTAQTSAFEDLAGAHSSGVPRIGRFEHTWSAFRGLGVGVSYFGKAARSRPTPSIALSAALTSSIVVRSELGCLWREALQWMSIIGFVPCQPAADWTVPKRPSRVGPGRCSVLLGCSQGDRHRAFRVDPHRACICNQAHMSKAESRHVEHFSIPPGDASVGKSLEFEVRRPSRQMAQTKCAMVSP